MHHRPCTCLLLQNIVFELWQRVEEHGRNENVYLGRAVVGLHPLLLGFHEIAGWYHINDEASRHIGQLKVRTCISAVGLIRARSELCRCKHQR